MASRGTYLDRLDCVLQEGVQKAPRFRISLGLGDQVATQRRRNLERHHCNTGGGVAANKLGVNLPAGWRGWQACQAGWQVAVGSWWHELWFSLHVGVRSGCLPRTVSRRVQPSSDSVRTLACSSMRRVSSARQAPKQVGVHLGAAAKGTPPLGSWRSSAAANLGSLSATALKSGMASLRSLRRLDGEQETV